MTTPADVHEMMLPYFRRDAVEVVWLLALNGQRRMIGGEPIELSRGTADQALVSPRDIMRTALVAGAVSIILAHNHPSGDPTPSREDEDVTRRVAAAGRVVGVPLLDHVVLTTGGFVSLADRGAIEA